MVQAEALARLRILINETSAGFWDDTQLYKLLDSSQNMAIQLMLGKEDMERKLSPHYRHPSLQAIIANNSKAATVSVPEYAFSSFTSPITDYIRPLFVNFNYASGQATATLVTYEESKYRNLNSFTAPAATAPIFYVRANIVGLNPAPDSMNSVQFFYYKTPVPVDASHDFTLTAETHESIIYGALALALQKDSRAQEADIYFNKFNRGILAL